MRCPKFVVFEAYSGCVAKCVICPISESKRTKGPMNEAVFQKALNELKCCSDSVEWLDFAGFGEPLLNRNLESMISAVRDSGFKNIQLTTNGALMDSNRSRGLIEAGCDTMIFSFSSINKDTYEKYQGLKHELVLENIHNFISIRNRLGSKLRITLRFIPHELNKDEFVEYESYWKKYIDADLDTVQYSKQHNWAMPMNGTGNYGNSPCPHVYGLLILIDGTIPLCCLDEYHLKYNFGNVNEENVLGIINNEKFNTIRLLHEQNKRSLLELCSTCSLPEHWLDNTIDPSRAVSEVYL